MTAATLLRRALLDGGAQQRDGAEAGGVAGSLAVDGRAAYVYGEITGYYLHWLASPPVDAATPGHGAAGRTRRDAAQAALAWVERRYARGALPPTRIELGAPGGDWRNLAQFAFDLAMLVGGLAAAAKAGLIDPPVATLRALYAALLPFADGERGLLPYRTDDGSTLAPRWSTRAGPFLVKAAQRMLLAEPIAALPPGLAEAARAHAARFRPASLDAFEEPVHPTLYFLEGHLALPGADATAAARLFEQLLGARDAHGTLPESRETPAVRRSDIVAQALRVGVLLRAARALPASADAALAELAGALAARVRCDGTLPFDPAAVPLQLNVWGAMFAEQALAWHARHAAGLPLGVTAADLV